MLASSLLLLYSVYPQKELQNLEEAGDELMLADEDELAMYPAQVL